MFGRNEIRRSFRIESEIGSGGGGAVYKAWHKRMQKYVVVKEHKLDLKSDAEMRRNELEALKNMKCAYLPMVFDYVAVGKRSFTVMEYIEGESFDKLLKRGKKSTQSQLIKWYGQLASALESLHRQDVCHRDIKPSNIMLTAGGDVCLIDFNAALVRGEKTCFASRSLGYASPEQYDLYERLESSRIAPVMRRFYSAGICPRYRVDAYQADPGGPSCLTDYNSRVQEAVTEYADDLIPRLNTMPANYGIDWKSSDIFSLGATMCHLLTGIHPPKRPVGNMIISEYGDYDKGIIYIIEKSMQYRPSDRFKSAAVLVDIIRQVKEHNSANSIITVG